jgi:homoserine kinase
MVSAGDAGPTVAHATQPVMSSRSLGLVGRRVVVEVPATSANLGAGYDCLGLALDITNEVEVEVLDDAELAGDGVGGHVELAVEGEGAGELRGDRSNRFVAGMEAAFGPAEFELPPGSRWRLAMRNRIPLSRGLGSSASATIGGLLAANALLGLPLDVPRLLRLATEIEGHPDNASAALLGGFVVSAVIDGEVEAIRFDAPTDLIVVLFIADLRLSTSDMRKLLPQSVPLADAVANLGRVALGVGGLAIGRADVLAALTVDRLHEPYREAAFPQLPRLIAAAREAGAIGACLSGAGSTVLAFCRSGSTCDAVGSAFERAALQTGLPGRVQVVSPRNEGARVVALA